MNYLIVILLCIGESQHVQYCASQCFRSVSTSTVVANVHLNFLRPISNTFSAFSEWALSIFAFSEVSGITSVLSPSPSLSFCFSWALVVLQIVWKLLPKPSASIMWQQFLLRSRRLTYQTIIQYEYYPVGVMHRKFHVQLVWTLNNAKYYSKILIRHRMLCTDNSLELNLWQKKMKYMRQQSFISLDKIDY